MQDQELLGTQRHSLAQTYRVRSQTRTGDKRGADGGQLWHVSLGLDQDLPPGDRGEGVPLPKDLWSYGQGRGWTVLPGAGPTRLTHMGGDEHHCRRSNQLDQESLWGVRYGRNR